MNLKKYFWFRNNEEASIGATLDVGLFVPAANSPAKISINAGLFGVLVSGKVGIKLSFFY